MIEDKQRINNVVEMWNEPLACLNYLQNNAWMHLPNL